MPLTRRRRHGHGHGHADWRVQTCPGSILTLFVGCRVEHRFLCMTGTPAARHLPPFPRKGSRLPPAGSTRPSASRPAKPAFSARPSVRNGRGVGLRQAFTPPSQAFCSSSLPGLYYIPVWWVAILGLFQATKQSARLASDRGVQTQCCRTPPQSKYLPQIQAVAPGSSWPLAVADKHQGHCVPAISAELNPGFLVYLIPTHAIYITRHMYPAMGRQHRGLGI